MGSVFKGRFAWKRWLAGFAVLAATMTSAEGFAKTRSRGPESVPGQYLVQLKRNKSTYNEQALEKALGARILRQVRPDIVLIERSKSEHAYRAVKNLKASSVVKIAEPNYIVRASKVPNDPDYTKLWGMSNKGDVDAEGTRGLAGIDIGAERAWNMTTGSSKVIVAVIDTGVDFSHPELADNAWVNTAEAKGQAGVDDDGNGYIDDINGYNFAASTSDPKDDNGHGTHCAGVIGARGDNNFGIAGVSWNVSIMAVKFLDANGGGTVEGAIQAIDYARKNGAHILSNSWGGNIDSELLNKAVQDTRDAGQIFVAAAGNDSADNDTTPTAPASIDSENIISVAAINNRGDLAWFSNYGKDTVDVAAPGHNIYSTVIGGRYENLSGTSMACPHVSGVAALMLAQNPRMTWSEVKQRLIESSRPLGTLRGKVVANGIVDAYYALSGDQPPKDPNDPAEWSTSPKSVSSPHPYTENMNQTYTITQPGAKRISVHFSRFETEAGFDQVTFYNKAGESLGSWSGRQSDRFSPISDGDTITLKFTSDSSIQGYGFDIDKVAFE